MTSNRFRLSVVAVAVAAALGAAYAGGGARAVSAAVPGAGHSASLEASAPALAGPVRNLVPTNIADVVAVAAPAVVNVAVSGRATAQAVLPPGFDQDSPFFEYFRRFMPPQGRAPTRGQGSGFIVSADGLVLTNAHVVDGASEVTVRLSDRREFRAEVVGLDKATDVAVLRIDGRDLPTVRMGDPAQARVGDWVVAIGAPFGFDNSVTAGIVSAKARALPDENYVPFIQTDVAINPGNSGGPLLNMSGEVIGINSQIYSRSGGYQGVSFAIPIDVARKVQQEIVADGRVRRGRLGVSIQEVNQSLAKAFGLEVPVGALVSDVEQDGPAARAGVRAGDVILSFDGERIRRASELPPLVASARPGSESRLEVWRDRKRQVLTVRVAELDSGAAETARADEAAADRTLGLTVRALSAQERAASGVAAGLRVESADGPAARAGVRPGDVVLALNGQPVRTPEELRAQLARAAGDVALLVERDGSRIFVPVPPA